jgi:hypothetical protein
VEQPGKKSGITLKNIKYDANGVATLDVVFTNKAVQIRKVKSAKKRAQKSAKKKRGK